jgi:hypothetical protein
MQGILEPYSDFKVDNFYSFKKNQFTFFLTHMHEGTTIHSNLLLDHLKGLSRDGGYGSY